MTIFIFATKSKGKYGEYSGQLKKGFKYDLYMIIFSLSNHHIFDEFLASVSSNILKLFSILYLYFSHDISKD